MSVYDAKVVWERKPQELYTDSKYSRAHQWLFDGGAVVDASASPQIVPLPCSVAANVDPEEAFVASLASCHMLFFLEVAAKKRYLVDRYVDNAIGVMEQDAEGLMSMTTVTLRVAVTFAGDKQPSREQLEKMHHLSHQQCFIANSVKTQVLTEVIFIEKQA